MAEDKRDRKAELEKARDRLRRLGVDLDKDLPDYPSAVLFPDFLPVSGSVQVGMGRVVSKKMIDRRFKKIG